MKDRTLNQNNWKRTQVRLPQPLYDNVFEYAEKHGISLNQAMIELLEKSLTLEHSRNDTPANIRIYHLENGIKRVVFGKLVNSFNLDYYNPNLSELREDIEYSLNILADTGSLKDKFMFLGKKVLVYQGGYHIDVVDDGKGSLNWIVVEDHIR